VADAAFENGVAERVRAITEDVLRPPWRGTR
jgi:hypothetical protein